VSADISVSSEPRLAKACFHDVLLPENRSRRAFDGDSVETVSSVVCGSSEGVAALLRPYVLRGGCLFASSYGSEWFGARAEDMVGGAGTGLFDRRLLDAKCGPAGRASARAERVGAAGPG